MSNSDKNPYPSDIPKKSPPHKEEGQNWNWDPSDEDLGVNPATKVQFDDEWISPRTVNEDGRGYKGKHTEHKYPHISIHDKIGTLKGKSGYLYRLFNCTIEELSAEEGCIIYARDCVIEKITGSASASGMKSRMHFVDCEIYEVRNISNYNMFFDGQTEFKGVLEKEHDAEFENISNSSITIYSTPAWDLGSPPTGTFGTHKQVYTKDVAQMKNFNNCDIVVSGPEEIYNTLTDAMHSNFTNCHYLSINQWFCTEARGGCTQPKKPWVKVFDSFSNCDVVNLDVKINNPEWFCGMYTGMTGTKISNINPNFEVHSNFFKGDNCNIASIGGTFFNCDIVHYHVKNSTVTAIRTEHLGKPGDGSILEGGKSDNTSAVFADCIIEVTNESYPVFEATDCWIRFYDCSKIKQLGTTNLFKDSDCTIRMFECGEISAKEMKVMEETRCKIDAYKNEKFLAESDDCISIEDNSLMVVKNNINITGKKKAFDVKNNSSLFIRRNKKIESETANAIEVSGQSKLRSNRDIIKAKLIGIKSASSFFDIFKGSIQADTAEISLTDTRGKITNVDLLSLEKIILVNSEYNFIDQECNILDISTESSFYLYNCKVKDRLVAQANMAKILTSQIESAEISGGLIFSSNNTYSSAKFSSSIGLIVGESHGPLSLNGLYLINNINCNSINASGIVIYDNVNCENLSFPAKRGIYATGKLDFFAVESVYITSEMADIIVESLIGNIKEKAAINISEEAGANIDEKAGAIATTTATKIEHN